MSKLAGISKSRGALEAKLVAQHGARFRRLGVLGVPELEVIELGRTSIAALRMCRQLAANFDGDTARRRSRGEAEEDSEREE
jgi:hypothetical protein